MARQGRSRVPEGNALERARIMCCPLIINGGLSDCFPQFRTATKGAKTSLEDLMISSSDENHGGGEWGLEEAGEDGGGEGADGGGESDEDGMDAEEGAGGKEDGESEEEQDRVRQAREGDAETYTVQHTPQQAGSDALMPAAGGEAGGKEKSAAAEKDEADTAVGKGAGGAGGKGGSGGRNSLKAGRSGGGGGAGGGGGGGSGGGGKGQKSPDWPWAPYDSDGIGGGGLGIHPVLGLTRNALVAAGVTHPQEEGRAPGVVAGQLPQEEGRAPGGGVRLPQVLGEGKVIGFEGDVRDFFCDYLEKNVGFVAEGDEAREEEFRQVCRGRRGGRAGGIVRNLGVRA